MEPYQIYMILGSSISLILGGLGWLLSLIKDSQSKIRQLEINLAVLEAIVKERGK